MKAIGEKRTYGIVSSLVVNGFDGFDAVNLDAQVRLLQPHLILFPVE